MPISELLLHHHDIETLLGHIGGVVEVRTSRVTKGLQIAGERGQLKSVDEVTGQILVLIGGSEAFLSARDVRLATQGANRRGR